MVHGGDVILINIYGLEIGRNVLLGSTNTLRPNITDVSRRRAHRISLPPYHFPYFIFMYQLKASHMGYLLLTH